MEPAALQALADRQAIVDTVVRWASALDAKDWAAARSCFTDEVETDYGDLRGTGAERLSADAFVELRRRALEPLTSAMLIHRLDPARAADNTFDTLAHYTHTLVRTPHGWRISRVRQAVAWNRGNAAIHSGAAGAR